MRPTPTTSDKATAWEIAARWVDYLAADTETVDRVEVRCHLAAIARSMRQRAAEERKTILHETGSTVVKACAALVRLTAPEDVDEAYVPRAAVVDIAMGLKRDMDALRSRAAAGGQGGGE